MSLSQADAEVQQQRVSVVETGDEGRNVKIQVERHDENLGWYTAGSLEIPRAQLPLLEQSLKTVHSKTTPDSSGETVIPFPTMAG